MLASVKVRLMDKNEYRKSMEGRVMAKERAFQQAA